MNPNDKLEDATGAEQSATFEYERPQVIDHGSIRDLTKSGFNVGSDGLSGSGGGGGS